MCCRDSSVCTLQAGDNLKSVARCKPGDTLLLASSNGLAMRFELDNLQPHSRTAKGVKVGRTLLAQWRLAASCKRDGAEGIHARIASRLLCRA